MLVLPSIYICYISFPLVDNLPLPGQKYIYINYVIVVTVVITIIGYDCFTFRIL